jgi:hypothetical protein
MAWRNAGFLGSWRKYGFYFTREEVERKKENDRKSYNVLSTSYYVQRTMKVVNRTTKIVQRIKYNEEIERKS